VSAIARAGGPSRKDVAAFAAIRAFANREGSTRAVALVRILIVLLVLVKWGEDLAFFRAPAPGVLFLSPLFFLCCALALVGYRTKAALAGLTAILALLYFWFGKTLGVHEWAHHHAYMLLCVTALLNGAPCEKSYSVDRYLDVLRAETRGAAAPPERGPLWAQNLIVLQMAALYFWTAIDKTEPHFLNGDRLERILEWSYAGHPAYGLLTQGWFLAGSSVVVVVIEYFLAYAVLARRFRRFTLLVAIGLHAAFYVLLKVDTYSATMIVLYLLYLDPEAVHRAIDRLEGAKLSASARPVSGIG
jgi:hypothetical protein